MTRRRLTIVLHWSVLILALVMVKGGTSSPLPRWLFVGAGAVWVGMALTKGLLGKPGPKLTGGLRSAFPLMHWGMYALVAVAVVFNAAALINVLPHDAGWNALLFLLAGATFHGLFHLWRHTALYDNALRVMTPRALHKYL